MRRIEYHRGRLIGLLFGGGFFAAMSLMLWQEVPSFLPAAGVALFSLLVFLSGRMLLTGKPAIAFDHQLLKLNSLWQSRLIEWHDVQDIRVDVRTVRLYGIIPVNRIYTLVVVTDGGLFGSRKVRFPAKMLDIAGGPPAVLALLKQARIAAVGEVAVAMKGAPQHGWGAAPVRSLHSARPPAASAPRPAQPSATFNPDEAIERYLAAKHYDELAASPPPVAVEPTPSMAPSLTPSPQQRPSFGRRSA